MNPTGIQSILHPTDFSRGDEVAFAHALRLGLAYRTVLHLLHVGTLEEQAEWADFPGVRETLSRWGLLEPGALHRDLAALGLQVRKAQKMSDDPAEAVSRFVVLHDVDLLVLSTHQRQGLNRLLHPGLAEAMARTSGTRTLFIPRRVPGFVDANTGAVNLRHILLPVDREPHPHHAVAMARDLVGKLGVGSGTLTLLHIGSEDGLPRIPSAEIPGWTLESVAMSGDVVDTILEVSDEREADLIVMGTRGHHGFLGLLRGTTTERVLRGAKCPVMAVPAG
ncbi:MAG: universal stress protein [Verrucomicrobiales bacterium]|nr:universal stress protein [Verrucomicrobiales bacterium]